MARRRIPAVPSHFGQAMDRLTHSDLVEIIWELMIASYDSPEDVVDRVVVDRVLEIVKSYKESRG